MLQFSSGFSDVSGGMIMFFFFSFWKDGSCPGKMHQEEVLHEGASLWTLLGGAKIIVLISQSQANGSAVWIIVTIIEQH